MFRRRKDATPPDPAPTLDAEVDWSAVPRRLRPTVDDAIDSVDRWRRTVARQPGGPLRDRLDDWTDRLDGAARQVIATATRVGEIESVLATLDPERVADEYKAAKRAAASGTPTPALDALELRFASVQRMLNVVGDAEDQLRILDARLGAAVAQGAELAVLGGQEAVGRLDADIEALVSDLDALRSALGDVSSS